MDNNTNTAELSEKEAMKAILNGSDIGEAMNSIVDETISNAKSDEVKTDANNYNNCVAMALTDEEAMKLILNDRAIEEAIHNRRAGANILESPILSDKELNELRIDTMGYRVDKIDDPRTYNAFKKISQCLELLEDMEHPITDGECVDMIVQYLDEIGIE